MKEICHHNKLAQVHDAQSWITTMIYKNQQINYRKYMQRSTKNKIKIWICKLDYIIICQGWNYMCRLSYFTFTLFLLTTSLYKNPILVTKYCDMSLLLLVILVLLKINLTQWVSFSCLWPIMGHVQNYYDILQFWGFSPKQKLPTLFITKKRVA